MVRKPLTGTKGRDLDAPASTIKRPAMIRTRHTARRHGAKRERHVAVRAAIFKSGYLSVTGPEQHDVFPERGDGNRLLFQFAGFRSDIPIVL